MDAPAPAEPPPAVTPLVSVVIPAYNASAYVLEAIRSVLAQTLREHEVIVVDDGSTDDTRAVAGSVPDARVRVIGSRNHGPAHARNVGCRAARARAFIAFLDADDRWDPEKLAEQTRFLDDHPELVAAGSFMRYVSSSGKVLGETGQRLGDDDLRAVAAGELFPFPMSSLIVRRTTLERAGLFDESFRYPGSEDLEFLSRLGQAGPLQCQPQVLGSYRVHPMSAMAKDRIRINFEARFVRQRIARRVEGRDLSWEEFRAGYRPTWAERRRDLVDVLYRSAALWHGEGNQLRAVGYGAMALLVDPAYALRRLRRQRLRRAAP